MSNYKTIEDMLNTHTKEEWARIIDKECEVLGLELVPKEKSKCICETDNLEEYDRLYKLSFREGGYFFKQIEIRYCPICGRKLPDINSNWLFI